MQDAGKSMAGQCPGLGERGIESAPHSPAEPKRLLRPGEVAHQPCAKARRFMGEHVGRRLERQHGEIAGIILHEGVRARGEEVQYRAGQPFER